MRVYRFSAITSTALCAKAAYIIVSKEEMKMTVYDNDDGKELLKFPIACGMNFGQKVKAGDNRTPEGVFKLLSRNLRHIGRMTSGQGGKGLTGLCLSG
ncbi:MAG: L,D-transpeptidase family protein [Butyricimonas paravirosa]